MPEKLVSAFSKEDDVVVVDNGDEDLGSLLDERSHRNPGKKEAYH